MILRIEKIVYPGKSLGFLNGKAVFTDQGLPGETVRVEAAKEKPTFIEARTVEVIEKSPRRVDPRCQHYRSCSRYQTMDYSFQLDIKKGQLREIFSRGAGLQMEDPEIVPSPEIWGYRNKVKLSIVWEGEEPYLAYHEAGCEDRFVEAERCFLVSDGINDLCHAVRKILKENQARGVEAVEVKESRAYGDRLAVLHCRATEGVEEAARALGELASDRAPAGVVALVPGRAGVREVRFWGRGHIRDCLGGMTFLVGARTFFQVNPPILEKAVEDMRAALRELQEPRLADLYSGAGTLGILLSREAREIYGVESDPENIAALKKNLTLNRVGNFSVCEGTTEEWTPELLEKGLDAAILDPPRRGVDGSILKALVLHAIPLLLYLSCNPATLARDLKVLSGAFAVRTFKAFDFFPHTPHIETLVTLSRK